MSKSGLLRSALCVVAGALLPSCAFAHAGVGETGAFLQGLVHPFGGLDHVCAMLAVGLWAAQMGGRSMWVVPLTFVGVMVLGGALGMVGISLPLAEPGIVLSVPVLGVLIAASMRLPLWLGGSMVGLFALCHGHAHGAEMPETATAMAYALGFLLSTASLHIMGILFGPAMRRLSVLSRVEGAHRRAVSLAGAGIALCGAYLVIA